MHTLSLTVFNKISNKKWDNQFHLTINISNYPSWIGKKVSPGILRIIRYILRRVSFICHIKYPGEIRDITIAWITSNWINKSTIENFQLRFRFLYWHIERNHDEKFLILIIWQKIMHKRMERKAYKSSQQWETKCKNNQISLEKISMNMKLGISYSSSNYKRTIFAFFVTHKT